MAEVKALACDLPAEQRVSLSRWSRAEQAREAVKRGIVAQVPAITVWRWLRDDAMRAWSTQVSSRRNCTFSCLDIWPNLHVLVSRCLADPRWGHSGVRLLIVS